jgi:hypothetical protein
MVLYITKKVPLQELIAYWRFKNSRRVDLLQKDLPEGPI